jgi:hypothetical protein
LGDECDIANENADCCNGLVCFEALCDNPSGLCMDEEEYCGDNELECCEGSTCVFSYCTAASLPDTGVGPSKKESSILGAGLLAGAALLAGKLVRRAPQS